MKEKSSVFYCYYYFFFVIFYVYVYVFVTVRIISRRSHARIKPPIVHFFHFFFFKFFFFWLSRMNRVRQIFLERGHESATLSNERKTKNKNFFFCLWFISLFVFGTNYRLAVPVKRPCHKSFKIKTVFFGAAFVILVKSFIKHVIVHSSTNAQSQYINWILYLNHLYFLLD